MKRALFIALVLLGISCEKEVQNCACNEIKGQDIQYVGVNTSYSGYVYTENQCSGYLDTVFVSGSGHNAPPKGSCL